MCSSLFHLLNLICWRCWEAGPRLPHTLPAEHPTRHVTKSGPCVWLSPSLSSLLSSQWLLRILLCHGIAVTPEDVPALPGYSWESRILPVLLWLLGVRSFSLTSSALTQKLFFLKQDYRQCSYSRGSSYTPQHSFICVGHAPRFSCHWSAWDSTCLAA